MSEQEDATRNEYPYGFAPVPNPDEEPKKTQSKLGIASFIIGLVSLVAFIAAIIVSSTFIMDHISLDGNSNTLRTDIENQLYETNDYVPLLIAGLLVLAAFGSSVVGLILGIVGACSKGKYKTFPVIGIIVNGLLPVGFVCLLALGIAMSGTA